MKKEKPQRAQVTGREKYETLTAAGSNLPSSPKSHPLVRGISMTPSTTTWATCTPLGPNSRARLWASARRANLALAKEAQEALPFTDAVAPVKIRDAGCGDDGPVARRRGSRSWEKWKAPFLFFCFSFFLSFLGFVFLLLGLFKRK